MVTEIKEKSSNRSFMVEKTDDRTIILTKKDKGGEIEVDLVVFTREEIDELREIQRRIHLEPDKSTSSLKEKIFALLKKNK